MINNHPDSELCAKCMHGIELKDSSDPMLYKCLEGYKSNSKQCNKIFNYSELECHTNCDKCLHANCS